MARRRKNDGTEELAWVLTICTLGAFFLIKWAIEAIVWLFKAIAQLIVWIANRAEKKKNVNNITNVPFENTTLKEEMLKLPEQTIKEKLNIFDKSIYDEMFPIQIRGRGESYFENDKIKYFKQNENKYTCTVKGTEDYKVSLTFKNDSDEIEEASCTCPYFADKNNNCKHIYALLYKVKCSNNKEVIINEIKQNLESIKKMIKNSQDYIDRNKSHFTSAAIQEHYNYTHYYDWTFKNIESKMNNSTLEDTLLKYLEDLIRISSELKEKIKKTLNSENTSNSNFSTSNTTKKDSSKIGLSDVVVGLAVANTVDNFIEKRRNDDEENVSGYTDDELNDYGLEDWQKDLVKKGEYDPWNFEEEDLEEDDYYYEDD